MREKIGKIMVLSSLVFLFMNVPFMLYLTVINADNRTREICSGISVVIFIVMLILGTILILGNNIVKWINEK